MNVMDALGSVNYFYVGKVLQDGYIYSLDVPIIRYKAFKEVKWGRIAVSSCGRIIFVEDFCHVYCVKLQMQTTNNSCGYILN